LSKNRHNRNLNTALSSPNVINIGKVIKWLYNFGTIKNFTWDYRKPQSTYI
jgi:hypothetical protein